MVLPRVAPTDRGAGGSQDDGSILVIASEAKQSIAQHMRRNGLLRRFSAKLLCNFVATLLAMTWMERRGVGGDGTWTANS